MAASQTDDRLRVALVITELEVGGAERCLANLAIRLDRRRFEPVVYSLAPRPQGEQGELVEALEAAGVSVRFVGVKSRWEFLRAVARLSRLLKEQSPHLVQTFLFHANIVGTLAARRAGVPKIVTGIRVADPSRWRQRVEGLVTRGVDKVVCVSESVARFAREKMHVEESRLAVIPNGLDLSTHPARETADLRQLGVPANRRAIVYVGRLDRQKGVDWLLKLAPRLFESLPDHDLLLVGDGPQRQELKSLATSLAIGPRVHFAGWRANVKEILPACDLLVLPSRWEGMPNVLLEAMASGLPVVSTLVEGVSEILGAAAVEQTAPANDAEQFQSKILALAQNAELSRSLGGSNRERAARNFSLRAMIHAYERLYLSLAGATETENVPPEK